MGEEMVKAEDMYKSYRGKLERLSMDEFNLWKDILPSSHARASVISAVLLKFLATSYEFLGKEDQKAIKKIVKDFK